MKSTGIVRKVDELGRIVLPKELRKTLGIVENEDALEIFVDGDKIVMKRYTPSCVFCSNVDDVVFYRGRNICKCCINELKSAIEQ